MGTMRAKPDFEWSLVRFDSADGPVRDDCSYCGTLIPEDAVPLRMWDQDKNGCVFCDACAEEIFGLQGFGEPGEMP
jgi:hypothetical protein